MVTKAQLLSQAEELGLEGFDGDSKMDEIQEAIKSVTEGQSFPLSELEAQAQALFGVPRSVIVGAKSAGFISDPSTKGAVEKGIQKFLGYGGKG